MDKLEVFIMFCVIPSNEKGPPCLLLKLAFVILTDYLSLNIVHYSQVKYSNITANTYIIIIIMSCHRHGYPWPPRHFSLSFIASSRSSGPHPVSSHSCWMYVRASPPAFVRPYVGVHWSTSIMSSSLLLQQCPACLVRLTWIVFVMGGRWPYSWWIVGCCRQDLFNIARSILV